MFNADVGSVIPFLLIYRMFRSVFFGIIGVTEFIVGMLTLVLFILFIYYWTRRQMYAFDCNIFRYSSPFILVHP